MQIRSHKDLTVWQRAIELVVETYNITKKFPKSEEFGLGSQMRRSAIAIPSNIAEGYRRKGINEYIQFLYIANASASELETQLIIALKVYPGIDYSKISSLLNEILKMLSSMIAKLKNKKSDCYPKR